MYPSSTIEMISTLTQAVLLSKWLDDALTGIIPFLEPSGELETGLVCACACVYNPVLITVICYSAVILDHTFGQLAKLLITSTTYLLLQA
jgi:hypothetical protein